MDRDHACKPRLTVDGARTPSPAAWRAGVHIAGAVTIGADGGEAELLSTGSVGLSVLAGVTKPPGEEHRRTYIAIVNGGRDPRQIVHDRGGHQGCSDLPPGRTVLTCPAPGADHGNPPVLAVQITPHRTTEPGPAVTIVVSSFLRADSEVAFVGQLIGSVPRSA